jgi:hypothetical protein
MVIGMAPQASYHHPYHHPLHPHHQPPPSSAGSVGTLGSAPATLPRPFSFPRIYTKLLFVLGADSDPSLEKYTSHFKFKVKSDRKCKNTL